MKKKHIERDPQLHTLLKDSLPPRSASDAENLTRRVMQRVPHRRRRPFLTLLLAYIQSPLWFATATMLCVLSCILRPDFIIENIPAPANFALIAALLSVVTVTFFHDMLRDVDRIAAT